MRPSRHPVLKVVGIAAVLHSVVSALWGQVPRDTLCVSSTVRAVVFIDGRERGTTPLEVELAADVAHRIELVAEGCAPIERWVEPAVRWTLLAPCALNGFALGLGTAALDLAAGRALGLEPRRVHVTERDLIPAATRSNPAAGDALPNGAASAAASAAPASARAGSFG